MKKILILAPYPLDRAPSQRFRFEHFLKNMEENGLSYDFQSFVSENGWKILYQNGFQLQKIGLLIFGFLKRTIITLKSPSFDYVLIHRELTPFGPPIFEWLMAKIFRKKIIYDFDDAIWLADQKHENRLWKTLKWRKKVASICNWSWRVSAGNEHLANFARQFCDQVVIFPTIVDTTIHDQSDQKPSDIESQKPVIGWTGSHSTLFYLDQVLPILQHLEKSFDFNFLVIANKDPQLKLKNYQFQPWNAETEVEDLQKMDIGVMPLEDNEWAKGKCGFKLIQYLSCGVPAVASPVGVNPKIVLNDETGFLASTDQEWIDSLSILLGDPILRTQLGTNGRKLIEEEFSLKSQQMKFLDLFKVDE